MRTKRKRRVGYVSREVGAVATGIGVLSVVPYFSKKGINPISRKPYKIKNPL